ncbi:hypothetical protein INT47_011128 [Mucor saturninus]|uniref:Uncharacterized protein n=1 Tax=Mucor saturninus TaxID=64648 RepID=A0A8H7VA31_9FUNG|nr:hypothetical protein INT47_011128 [Mucor saturninus]
MEFIVSQSRLKNSSEFSKLLFLKVLSLEERYKNEVKTLNFADGHLSEVSITSDSTNSNVESEDSDHEPEDEDFVENTKVMLDELREEEKGLKRFHDWEDMLLYECSKRLKTRN